MNQAAEKICKNCAKWTKLPVRNKDSAWLRKAGDDNRYRLCGTVKDVSENHGPMPNRDLELAFIVSYDAESYQSYVETRFDFGCNQWEPPVVNPEKREANETK